MPAPDPDAPPGSGERVAFLFDMDGTLLDNMPYHTQAWLQLLASDFGLTVDAKDWERRTAGKPTIDILRHEIDPDIPDTAAADFGRRKEALYHALYAPHRAPARGLEPFLRDAAALGVPMAVCTSADRPNVEFALGPAGVLGRFSAVVTKDDVSRAKPDPQVFLRAADRLGIRPERCVVFEDAPVGVEAARRAGMKAVALTAMLDAAEMLPLAPVFRAAPDFTALHAAALARAGRADVRDADPRSAEAGAMIAALTGDIAGRYAYRGDTGRGAFKPEDALGPRAAFVVARLDGAPVGCGALRPFANDDGAAEVKRMYVAPSARGLGIARLILHALEERARAFGFRATRLETGDGQPEAKRLYETAGYARIPCYGQYAAQPWSRCFEKALAPPSGSGASAA